MELKQYFKPIIKWWWLILVSGLITAGLSYYVVSQEPPTYESKSTLMIGSAFENPNPSGNELFLAQQLARTYADIAGRQPVQNQTMAVLGLDWLPDYVVRPVPNSQLLEIIVHDVDTARAQAVASELANQIILQSPTASGPEQQERESFIEEQLRSIQANISQTEEAILDKQLELEAAFSAREIADLKDEISGLESKLGTLQANFASLLDDSRAGATNTLAIIEPATLPQAPVGPKKLLTTAVATFISVSMAVGVAFLLEYLNDSISTGSDIQQLTGQAPLPTIPDLKDSKGVSIIALEQRLSPDVEPFRALRASIQHKYEDEPNRLILVTSAAPAEGKSTISANLAVVFAQAGMRVLLIDADLRRPTQHKLFGITNYLGLSELLKKYRQSNGKTPDIERLLSLSVQPTRQDNLNLLVSGRTSSDGAQILNLATMKEMLITASHYYDYVILDSPPVLAAADAAILSANVDTVLMVALAGKTRRNELSHALALLEDVNAKVLGVVLNKMKVSSEGYYYRYYDYIEKPKKKVTKSQQEEAGSLVQPPVEARAANNP